MTKSIISAQTRMAFSDYFANTTLRYIRDSFDKCEVRCDPNYNPPNLGQRRTLVEQYYYTIDWTNQKSINSILKVFENEINYLQAPVDFLDSSETKEQKEQIAKKIIRLLKLDGFEWKNGKFILLTSDSIGLGDITEITNQIDGAHIQMQIQRMRNSIDTDPSLVLGSAKELIETVCKTILEERGLSITGKPDIPTLTKALLKELLLVPEGVEDDKRGADLIKAILRSLGTIGNDLAQLRGLYGTGHGKSAKTMGLQARHAKLAAGAAATFVTFLYDTHQEKQAK